jgi:hypothetical protein
MIRLVILLILTGNSEMERSEAQERISAGCLIKYVISGENEIERDFRKSKACVFVRKEFLFANYK